MNYRGVKHIGPVRLKHIKKCRTCQKRAAYILAGGEVYKAIRLSKEA